MTPNLFTDLPAALPEELFTTLLQAPGIHIERIGSQGHKSAEGFWYDQDQAEWVLVFQGAARLRFEDRVLEMRPEDFVNTRPTRSTEWHGQRRTGPRSGWRCIAAAGNGVVEPRPRPLKANHQAVATSRSAERPN